MNYLNFLSPELFEIIISFLAYDDFLNFKTLITLDYTINFSLVYFYHFNTYKILTILHYQQYIGLEDIRGKLNLIKKYNGISGLENLKQLQELYLYNN